MNDSPKKSPDTVTTTIRMRAWFLKTFLGYHVDNVHRAPKQNIFGEIYYKTSWVLIKRR